MLGIIFLLVAIILYLTGHRRFSLLLFIFMSARFMSIIPMRTMAFNGVDLAIVYMVVISLIQGARCIKFREDPELPKIIRRLAIFLVTSFIVGMIYYGLTPFQSFMGCRQLWLFPAYFFLRNVPPKDIIWLFKILFYISLIHAILYIIQCLTGLPVLGELAPELDVITNTLRYNNHPIYMTLFFYLSLLFPKYFGKKISLLSALIFAVAAFLTMTRTIIVLMILLSVLGIYLSGKKTTIIKFAIIGAIIIIPLSAALSARFGEEAGTDGDVEALIHGEFIDYARTGIKPKEAGTLTYRIAWVYERAEYVLTHGVVEFIFGLGFLPPSEPAVASRLYNFKVGAFNDDIGIISPNQTPDIGYGNIIAQYGVVGAILFLSLWIRLTLIHARNKRSSPIIFCMFLYLLTLFGTSIAGQGISIQGLLILPYLTANLALMESSKESPIRNTQFNDCNTY